ncbi:MAG: fucose isomerase [Clostridiales bacterium]|nr:fucose isomerase [Clostridiales bacterium]
MREFKIAYIPIGVPTFSLSDARNEFNKSSALLKSICENTFVPEDLLLSLDKLNAYLDTIDPDLIVLQNATFANAAYTQEIVHRFPHTPVLLWALREPVIDGGRLRLNSLTGAYSAANTLRQLKKEQVEFVFGSPDEKKVINRIESTVRAAQLRLSLQSLKLAQIGHTPQGFGFGRAMDTEMQKTFGVRVVSIESRELIEKANKYTDEECMEYLNDAEKRTVGMQNVPEVNRKGFARLYKAYYEFAKENGIGAVCSRCWPDFFTSFGTPVCTVLGILNDLNIAASCEADAYGALSMYMGMQLTGMPAFFGDPVSLNEEENSITFWHCGMAACSLARENTGAVIGEHCNRHIGPTLEFGCRKAANVTVFRVGKSPEGSFRFFIASGEAMDKEKQFFGTSMTVKMDGNAEKIVRSTIEGGWEPHFAVIYGDAADSLEVLGHMLDIEVQR